MLIELYLITIIIYGHSHPHGRMVMKLPLASHNLRPFKPHFVLDVPNGLEFTKDYGFGQRYLMSAFIADFAGRCPARCEVYFSGWSAGRLEGEGCPSGSVQVGAVQDAASSKLLKDRMCSTDRAWMEQAIVLCVTMCNCLAHWGSIAH